MCGYAALQLAGADPVPWSPADLGGRTSLFSTLGNVNWLAGWLALAIPLMVPVPPGPGAAAPRGGLPRLARLLPPALSVALLFATRSRAALLALLFALAWMAAFHPAPRRRKIRLAAALFAVALAADLAVRLAGGLPLTERLRFAGSALADRAVLWGASSRLAAGEFPFGAGPGGYARWYPDLLAASGDLSPVARAGFARHAHNDFVQILAEGGLLALAGLLILLAGGLVRAARSDDPRSICAGASLCAAIPLACLDTVLFHPALWLLVVLAQVSAGGERLPARATSSTAPAFPGSLRRLARPLLLAALAWMIAQSFFALRSASLHARGNHALARGDRKAARPLFAEAARVDPRNAEALYLHGALELEAGEPALAGALLERAAQSMSEPGLFYDLALAAERGAFPGKAAPPRLAAYWYARAAALATGPLLVSCAFALDRLEAPGRAEEALLRALALDHAADTVNLALTPLLDRAISARLAAPSPALHPLLAERARHLVAGRLSATGR